MPFAAATTASCARPRRQVQEAERVEDRMDSAAKALSSTCRPISAARARRRARPCRPSRSATPSARWRRRPRGPGCRPVPTSLTSAYSMRRVLPRRRAMHLLFWRESLHDRRGRSEDRVPRSRRGHDDTQHDRFRRRERNTSNCGQPRVGTGGPSPPLSRGRLPPAGGLPCRGGRVPPGHRRRRSPRQGRGRALLPAGRRRGGAAGAQRAAAGTPGRAVTRVRARLGDVAGVNAVDLLRWPGVVREGERDTNAAAGRGPRPARRGAGGAHGVAESEGGRIAELLAARCDGIEALANEVSARLPEVRERIRTRSTKSWHRWPRSRTASGSSRRSHRAAEDGRGRGTRPAAQPRRRGAQGHGLGASPPAGGSTS